MVATKNPDSFFAHLSFYKNINRYRMCIKGYSPQTFYVQVVEIKVHHVTGTNYKKRGKLKFVVRQ